MADAPAFATSAPRPDVEVLREANQQLVLALLRSHVAGGGEGAVEAVGRGAERDPLTGLPGRTTLRRRFEVAAAAARHEGKRLGLLFLDLDGFKQVNDDLGHRAGDAALRHVARCLNAAVRGSDTVSRHGGDEFVVLLTDLSAPADAGRVAENMLGRLAPPQRIAGRAVSLSASIGISLFPDDGTDLEELIHLADRAMYRAKHRGPGVYLFAGAGAALPPRTAPPAPGALPPVVAPASAESPGQAMLQEANEHLLLAALSARDLQTAAERALGDQTALLARVAHELRNPLTPICVAASLLDGAHVDELPQLRALIERQVDHVSRLVGDLLDLSRSKVGKLRLQRETLDLRDVVADVIDAFRPAIEARRQHLAVELPGSPLWVCADRVRLVQVLSNLVDNASKYTPAEGTLAVEAHASADDVFVGVADTGVGIPADLIDKVFQPFVQEPRATKFQGSGLGIGLTVVRELAEAHGGTVQAFSGGAGQGSRFVVTLPRLAYADVADGTGDRAPPHLPQ